VLLELAFAFLSARFSFRDLAATVLALLFFGDLSAIGHPSLGSTDGFGTAETTPESLDVHPVCTAFRMSFRREEPVVANEAITLVEWVSTE
jgi:hypothetical protein